MTPIDLRALTRADYALLARWLAQPHVSRWWNHETSPGQIEADFGAVIDGDDPAQVFVASTNGRPFGLIQRYTFADNPAYLEELASLVRVPNGAFSVDYFVGEPGMLNRGWGRAMLQHLLLGTWEDFDDASCVIIPVVAANNASWRMLEAAGMSRIAEGPLTPDNPIDGDAHFIYRIDRPPRPA